MDVGVELGDVLEEINDFIAGLLVHVHAGQDAIFARGALEVARVEKFLLSANVQRSPGRVGFGEAVLFAGYGVIAVDLLVAVRRGEGGVGHAELHVAVVPSFILAWRVAAEVDLEAGALAVFGGEGADESLANVELDGLAGQHGCGREGALTGAVRCWWVIGVAFDLVHVGLGGRGVDEVDDGATWAVIGDTLGVRHFGGAERKEDGDCREECE